MRKGGNTDHCRQIVPARGGKHGRSGPHGMADQPYPLRVHARLAFEPVHSMVEILGESGHGRKSVQIALTMAAGIEEQQRVTGTMQGRG